MTTAVVFPGQGSQSVGMLKGFDQGIVHQTLEEASQALGWDMAALIAKGPEAQLNQTQYTQPAILAASIALWRLAVEQTALAPSVLAGHSLGEYSALVASGALGFADALRLVEARGRYMQMHAPEGSGMAAVLGMDDSAVEALCAQRPEGGLYPVNYNAPGQVVVAGRVDALAWLEAEGSKAGARKIARLAMSVPSHCVLLEAAADALTPELQAVTLSDPRIPVLHNVDAAPRSDSASVREALRRQLCEPVRWTQTQSALQAQGVTLLVECGPGKVLCGLAKRGMRGVKNVALGGDNGLDTLAAALAQQ